MWFDIGNSSIFKNIESTENAKCDYGASVVIIYGNKSLFANILEILEVFIRFSIEIFLEQFTSRWQCVYIL